jgi:NAD-dependent deacetylase
MPANTSWEPLAAVLAGASRIIAFTGAGISTESGIPDFRSPGGVWTRYDPRDFTFSRYVASAEVRRRSWDMRREFWASGYEPNAAHRAVARLEQAGRLAAVVTQNIDGLHQVAGSTLVIELHGTAREVMCIGQAPAGGTPAGCGFVHPTTWAFERIDVGEADPACPSCGGLVKSATVSFGQSLFPGVIEEARTQVLAADLVLAIGSSLQVYPAAGIPAAAAAAGVPVAIVNDEPTPFDSEAGTLVRGRAGVVLPPAVDAALARAG